MGNGELKLGDFGWAVHAVPDSLTRAMHGTSSTLFPLHPVPYTLHATFYTLYLLSLTLADSEGGPSGSARWVLSYKDGKYLIDIVAWH